MRLRKVGAGLDWAACMLMNCQDRKTTCVVDSEPISARSPPPASQAGETTISALDESQLYAQHDDRPISAISERYNEGPKQEAQPPREESNVITALNRVQHQQRQDPGMVTPLQNLAETPANVDCPRCKAVVKTEVEKESGDQVSMWACICCLVTGLLCVWLPCVIDDCKDTVHSCSVCHLRLATRTAGGAVKVEANAALMTQSQYYRPKEEMKALPEPVGAEADGKPLSELAGDEIRPEAAGTPVAEMESKVEVHEMPGENVGRQAQNSVEKSNGSVAR